ncbi:hypothetical protein LQZ19_12350 [Treponema primitia]|uniref:hypothetical protein n=1 Tax=Treponema primitia TaxID=88058 RepID=UPI00397EEA5F
MKEIPMNGKRLFFSFFFCITAVCLIISGCASVPPGVAEAFDGTWSASVPMNGSLGHTSYTFNKNTFLLENVEKATTQKMKGTYSCKDGKITLAVKEMYDPQKRRFRSTSIIKLEFISNYSFTSDGSLILDGGMGRMLLKKEG